jgi:hypothetical protein
VHCTNQTKIQIIKEEVKESRAKERKDNLVREEAIVVPAGNNLQIIKEEVKESRTKEKKR